MEHYNFEQVSAEPLTSYRHVGWDPHFLKDCGLSDGLVPADSLAWNLGFLGLAWRFVAGSEVVVMPGWDAQYPPHSNLGPGSVVQWRYVIDAEDEGMFGRGFRDWEFVQHRNVPLFLIEDWRGLAEAGSFSYTDTSDVTGIFGLGEGRAAAIRKGLALSQRPRIAALLEPGEIFIVRHSPREVDMGDPRVPCIVVMGHDVTADTLERATADLYGAVGQFRRNARHFCSMDEVQSAIEDVVAPPSWGT